jgi:ubiquinone/menaquinone biosynthesis C-methylase UbiE
MNFDGIAPFYNVMERLAAGQRLHRCRVAFLDEIPVPKKALLVGEGHGRFLLPFRQKFPDTEITVLDGSAKMLEIAKQRLEDNHVSTANTTFVRTDLRDWRGPAESYDLIVTNFMLDCLTPPQIDQVVAQLSHLAKPAATWLIADFEIAPNGAAKFRTRAITWLLYTFFRLITRIPANALHSPNAALEANGFLRTNRKTWEWGLLKSEQWTRKP